MHLENRLARLLPFALFTIVLLGLFTCQSLAQQEIWTPLGLSATNPLCAAVAPGNSNIILVGGNNLYVTTDGGSTWSTKSNLISVWSVAFGSNSNVAYAGTWGNGGVFRSTDGGVTWVRKSTGLPDECVKVIRVMPGNDSVVFAGTQLGLYKSTNSGDNWSAVATGHNVSCFAISAANTSLMYYGTWNAGVYKSTNGGTTWTQLNVGSPATSYFIAIDPYDDNTVYITFQDSGTWRTMDGGSTWVLLTPGYEGFASAVDKSTARQGFVYGVGGWTVPQRSGCYGATGWKALSASWPSGVFARSIAVDPNDSSRVYACGSGNTGGLYRWICDVTTPNAPTNPSAAGSTNGLAISWTASDSTDTAGYWIYRRTASGAYSTIPYTEVTGSTTYNDLAVIAGTTYYYKIAAFDNAQNRSALTAEVNATVPNSYDLDVTCIERTPHDTSPYTLEYPDGVPLIKSGYENLKRFPAFGEKVTFVAHYINKGTANPGSVNCRWTINGVVVATGIAPGVNAGQEGTVSLDWNWNVSGLDQDHSDQTIKFEIDFDNRIAETTEVNNSLTDFIEGCALAIYVQPGIYAAFNSTQNLVGTYSFEDWIQAQIKAMNANFARSTYPMAPRGCLERVRIDKIKIVDVVPEPDGTTDGRWQFTGDPAYAQNFKDRVDGGLIHELNHQLGVLDLYQYGVMADMNQVITPDGLPNGTTWGCGRPGIMAGGDISPHTSGASQTMPEYNEYHTVMGLNLNCGYRRGYYGEYQFDVPTNNYILIKDSAGNSVPNADIKVFQCRYGALSGSPVITGKTDSNGKLLLTNRPVARAITTATGHTEHPNPFGTIDVVGGQSILLIEASRPGGDFDYAWMDLTQFNFAYWSGYTDSWTYTINTRLGASQLPRISKLNGTVAGSSINLTWPAVPGAVSYTVYRASSYLNQASDTTHQYENWVFRPIATGLTGTSYSNTISENSRYAVVAKDSAGKEAPLSNRFFAPNLLNPWAVIVKPGDERVVLDPQNGYAFMRQGSDGIYIANTGSVHNHVEFSQFMAIDTRLNKLLISHPTDWYGGPHSIRITDLNASLDGLRDLGTYGTGPGQFNNPGGVAVDSESRIYAVDTGNNRIQVFTSNGDFLVQFGGSGSGNGQFNNPKGIAVGANHTIYVCDKGNARVQILQFDPVTKTISYVGKLNGRTMLGPCGVVVASTGSVFVTDQTRNTVEAFSSSGNFMRTYSVASGVYSGSFLSPTGIALDSKGTLIVCDTGNKRVATIVNVLPISVSDARKAANSAAVQLEGKVVTNVFSGGFYIQDNDHMPGIRVISSTTVSIGQKVDVYGGLYTVKGEREIHPGKLIPLGMADTQPKPAIITMKSFGGAQIGDIPGVTGSLGLNTVGLLVRVTGHASSVDTSARAFVLDDDSGIKVRVEVPTGVSMPVNGARVLVTGVGGADDSLVLGKNVRVIRARSLE